MKFIKINTILFALTLLIVSCSIAPKKADSLIGTWKHSETKTLWMQDKPRTVINTISVKKRNQQYHISIKINGHNSCSAEGIALIKESYIYLDTSSELNKNLNDFTNASIENPCQLTLHKEENHLKIITESRGCRS